MCKFGRKDYKKSFDKKTMVPVAKGYPRKAKVCITAKKGYKIVAIYYSEHGTGRQRKIKNGSTVILDGEHYLQILYKNTSKIMYHRYIWMDIVCRDDEKRNRETGSFFGDFRTSLSAGISRLFGMFLFALY